jgi:Putative MetA-pathway of phenol degradation
VLLTLVLSSACATMGRVESSAPALESGRPDFTESTETVPTGSIQAEGGYTFSRERENTSYSIGELVLRVPASSRAELLLGFNSYSVERAPALARQGFEDMEIGTRVRLIEREDRSLIPSISILALSTLPTGRKGIGTSVMQPTAKLAFGWHLSEKLSLGSNANYSYASEDGTRFSQWATSASLGVDVTPRLDSFLEWFSTTPVSLGERSANYVDAGAGMKFGGSLRLDAHAGANTRGAARDFFVGFGVTRRW